MGENYSRPEGLAAGPAFDRGMVRALLGRLAPMADAELLLHALLSEQPGEEDALPSPLGAETTPAMQELARVRRLYRAGEAAQTVHLAMSNTLTALQTEAQLLELEPLAEEHRRASSRIVELTRRLATVLRRLDPPGGPG
jgi:hypothetical protein